MSWFSSKIAHPAINALAGLLASPAVQSNPEVKAQVAAAQTAATVVATSATSAAHQVATAAAAEADPAISALGNGLTAGVDAYLSTFGPPGALATPVVNALLAMGEQYAHNYVAALFAHAGLAHAAAASAPAQPAS